MLSKDLPMWLMEPDATGEKRDLAARKLLGRAQKSGTISETISIDDIKQRLARIREYTRDNISSLIAELKSNMNQRYPQVKVKLASDSVDATRYISEISDGIKIISTNNSCVVTQELKPGLESNGFTVINSYLNEFDVKERKILDYWDLPRLFDKNLTGTFDVAIKMTSLPDIETKKYLAVLGVNAISAEDTTVFLLQHFLNIHKDLRQANKVILVVGIDKIVKTRQEATLQTQCMGIFGIESVLLGIEPRSGEAQAIDELLLAPCDKEQELHVIILDNARSQLLESKFRDLLLCIGCRACNRHCPIRHSFTNIWTPKNYLSQFLSGTGKSIDICLHCEACRIECPLKIDLPYLMWQAKKDYTTRHGMPFSHKVLGRPEWLAKLGSAFAPLTNWMMSIKPVRIVMEGVTGINRNANLPTLHFRTFRKWFRGNVRGFNK